MTGSNNHYSLISLNINGINAPIKRHRLTEWIRKQDPTFCCLEENTNTRRETSPWKKQDSNLSSNPKEVKQSNFKNNIKNDRK